MLKIDAITSDPYQKHTLFLPSGKSLSIIIYFRPLQYGWFIEELIYEEFEVRGIRICNLPNILLQFINQIPFGLACFSRDNREPTLQEDFISGASELFLLDEPEKEEYLRILRGQV